LPFLTFKQDFLPHPSFLKLVDVLVHDKFSWKLDSFDNLVPTVFGGFHYDLTDLTKVLHFSVVKVHLTIAYHALWVSLLTNSLWISTTLFATNIFKLLVFDLIQYRQFIESVQQWMSLAEMLRVLTVMQPNRTAMQYVVSSHRETDSISNWGDSSFCYDEWHQRSVCKRVLPPWTLWFNNAYETQAMKACVDAFANTWSKNILSFFNLIHLGIWKWFVICHRPRCNKISVGHLVTRLRIGLYANKNCFLTTLYFALQILPIFQD
jgi:hypothetical protein